MRKEEEIARFVAFCIERHKLRHGGDCETAFGIFERSGALRFLAENFDVEHCLDPEQISDDVDAIIARHFQEGGK